MEESERRRGDRRRALSTGAVTSLTAAITDLLKQLSDRTAANELTANVDEAARLLKVSRRTVERMVAAGDLTVFK